MKKLSIIMGFVLLFGPALSANAAALNTLSGAVATKTFDSLNFAQTWDWSTASTQNAFSFDFNGLTSGAGLRILSSATGLTGNLESITLNGSNAANTGNLLFLSQSGASSAAIPLNISNLGTGNSLKITSGTVPFVVTSTGKVGVATSSPASLLSLGTAGTTAGTLSLAGSTSGTVTLQTPAAAGSVTITFPATTGTVITSGDSATITNSMLAGGITVANGGTGVATLAANGVLLGNGTGAINVTSAGTAGQVLTSNGTGVNPTFQTVSAGGTNTQIQFNNSSNFGGMKIDYTDDTFTRALKVEDPGATANGEVLAITGANGGVTSGNGGAVNITAGDGSQGDGSGGGINLSAGVAPAGNNTGGNVIIRSGNSHGSQMGARIDLTAGNGGATANGGQVSLSGGLGGSVSGTGGGISLFGGFAQGGNSAGGSITLSPGGKSGTGLDGVIRFQDVNSARNANFDTSSLATTDKTFTFPNQTGTFCTSTAGSGAPSGTPASIGQIYVDTTAVKVYVSTGTTSSADWQIVN